MADTDWLNLSKPRNIWLISEAAHPWVAGLLTQLTYFGYLDSRFDWTAPVPDEPSALVILFLPAGDYRAKEIEHIARIRAQHPASQLFCLSVSEELGSMVKLLRAGADLTIPVGQQPTTVLSQVLDLIQSQDKEPYLSHIHISEPTRQRR